MRGINQNDNNLESVGSHFELDVTDTDLENNFIFRGDGSISQSLSWNCLSKELSYTISLVVSLTGSTSIKSGHQEYEINSKQ